MCTALATRAERFFLGHDWSVRSPKHSFAAVGAARRGHSRGFQRSSMCLIVLTLHCAPAWSPGAQRAQSRWQPFSQMQMAATHRQIGQSIPLIPRDFLQFHHNRTTTEYLPYYEPLLYAIYFSLLNWSSMHLKDTQQLSSNVHVWHSCIDTCRLRRHLHPSVSTLQPATRRDGVSV